MRRWVVSRNAALSSNRPTMNRLMRRRMVSRNAALSSNRPTMNRLVAGWIVYWRITTPRVSCSTCSSSEVSRSRSVVFSATSGDSSGSPSLGISSHSQGRRSNVIR